jgi:hypothetical protein
VLANFGLHPARPRLVLAPAALSSDYEQNRRSAARLAGLRPRLACFGHGFAITDPGRFATAIQQLGPAPLIASRPPAEPQHLSMEPDQ